MPYSGDWTYCDPGETDTFSVDFAPRLTPSGDSIASLVSAVMSVWQGVDANVGSIIIGSPAVSGTICTVKAGGNSPAGFQPSVGYRIMFTILTTQGRTLSNYCHVNCQKLI